MSLRNKKNMMEIVVTDTSYFMSKSIHASQMASMDVSYCKSSGILGYDLLHGLAKGIIGILLPV